jgi:hypothetical protein
MKTIGARLDRLEQEVFRQPTPRVVLVFLPSATFHEGGADYERLTGREVPIDEIRNLFPDIHRVIVSVTDTNGEQSENCPWLDDAET